MDATWLERFFPGLASWQSDVSFRTARGAVGAARYQPRQTVLASSRQLDRLNAARASQVVGRLSRRLDGASEALSGLVGRGFGATAEAWVRWLTSAGGGVADAVGGSLIDDLPNPGFVRPSMLKPHLHTVGVLVVDMRGFSKLTVALDDPGELTRRIEEYLATLTAVVEQHGGVVFQYTGDGLLALFLPELTGFDRRELIEHLMGPTSTDLHSSFLRLYGKWLNEWRGSERPLPTIGLGVGVAYGAGMIGMMGPAGRKYFGIVGAPVNQAAFFCSKARAGTTLIDELTVREMGAAPPEESRRIRLKSEKLHQRIATLEIRPPVDVSD